MGTLEGILADCVARLERLWEHYREPLRIVEFRGYTRAHRRESSRLIGEEWFSRLFPIFRTYRSEETPGCTRGRWNISVRWDMTRERVKGRPDAPQAIGTQFAQYSYVLRSWIPRLPARAARVSTRLAARINVPSAWERAAGAFRDALGDPASSRGARARVHEYAAM